MRDGINEVVRDTFDEVETVVNTVVENLKEALTQLEDENIGNAEIELSSALDDLEKLSKELC